MRILRCNFYAIINCILLFFVVFNFNLAFAGNLDVYPQKTHWRNALAELVSPTGLFIRESDSGEEEVIIQSTKPYAALAKCSYIDVNGSFIEKEIMIPPSFKGSLGEAISLFDTPYAFYKEFNLEVLPTAEIVETGMTDRVIGKDSSCLIVLGSKKDMSVSALAMVLSVVDLAANMTSVIAEQASVSGKGGRFITAMSASIKNKLMLEALKNTDFLNGISVDIHNSSSNAELLEKVTNRSLDFFNKNKNLVIDAYLKEVFKQFFPSNVSSELIGKAFDKALLTAKSLAVLEKFGNTAGIASHILARKHKGRSVISFYYITNKNSTRSGYVGTPLDYPLFVDLDVKSEIHKKVMFLQANRVTFNPDYSINNKDYFSPSKHIRTEEYLSLMYDLENRMYNSYTENFSSYLNDFYNSHLFSNENGSPLDNLTEYISYKDALHAMHILSKRVIDDNYVEKITPLCTSGYRVYRFRTYLKYYKNKVNSEVSAAYRAPIKQMYLTSSPPVIRKLTNFNDFLTRAQASSLLYDLVKNRVPCYKK